MSQSKQPIDPIVPHTLFGQLTRRQLLTLTAAGAAALAVRGDIARAQDAPSRGGTLRAAAVGPVTSLDPFTSKLSSGDQLLWRFLYDSLLTVTSTGDFAPEVATEWTVSDDGLTYTFTLRSDVKFHDGTALDAAAVKFNIDRYRQEGSTYPTADRLKVIDTVEAPDATTVVITLKTPNTPFLFNVGTAGIVSPTAVDALGEDFSSKAVGSGPFKIREWTSGSTATFDRWDQYWVQGADGQPLPYLDSVELEGVPDDSVRLLNLRSGEFDINERISPLDQQTVKSDPNITLVTTEHATPYILALNPTKAPFDNKALRQAVAASIDRQAIIDNVGYGTGYTIAIPFLPDSWFYIDGPQAVFDTSVATAKLAEAGYPDGIDITFTIINRPTDNQIAQIIKPYLDAVNIRTTIQVLERTTWVDLWNGRNGEMGLLQGGMTAQDPDEQSGWFSDTSLANYAGYDSPQIRDLIAQANATTDQAARLEAWKQIVQINTDDAVYTFIGAVPTVAGVRNNVAGFEIDFGYFWELAGVSLSQ
jgi:peptide/nickel transport system substrate-binding protein